jgi:hypothetical protein
MPKRNFLLLAAVAGLAGFICVFAILSIGIGIFDPDHAAKMDPGGTRRESVEQSLAEILPGEIDSAQAPELAAAAEKLAREPLIAWVWVVDPQGQIVLANNGPVKTGDNIRELSTYEEDLILAMDPNLLSPAAEMELRLAIALRREGEHNDIYRHLVRSIPGPDGAAAAFVGITYEAVDTAPGITDIACLILGAIGLLVYWLGLPLWVLFDSHHGGGWRTAILWGLFVLVANVAGLLAYLLVRHRSG